MNLRQFILTTVSCATLVVARVPLEARQKNDKEQEAKRPKIALRANPQVAIAPARVTLTVELTGGSDDFEEYYCPTVEWDWGDDTTSESTSDCDPYEAGKSQIKRRYTTQHQFTRPGVYKLYFHLKSKDRVLGSATTSVQVQPGLQSGPF